MVMKVLKDINSVGQGNKFNRVGCNKEMEHFLFFLLLSRRRPRRRLLLPPLLPPPSSSICATF